MEIDVRKILTDNPILLLFVVIGFGYLMGNLRIGPVKIGATAGVLLCGLLFGHFGYAVGPLVATFGFTLFIFSVGIQAGPTFFSAFRADGRRYVALAAFVAVVAVALTMLLSTLFTLEFGVRAGIAAGALTSTPTLAGAQDAITSGLAGLPEGVTAARAKQNVGVGYAITYIFGTVGLIMFVRYIPGLFKVDVVSAAREAEKAQQPPGAGVEKQRTADTLPIIRAYRLPDDVAGKTVEHVLVETGRKGRPLRVRRGRATLEAKMDLELQAGDVASWVASLADHRNSQERLGQEVLDPELLNYQVTTQEIVVLKDVALGHTLKDLDLVGRYGCIATGVIRATIQLPVSDATVLQKGDRLVVTGEGLHLKALTEEIGYVENEVEETDLLTFGFGVAAGILLGLVTLKIRGFSLGLGSAGGLLLIGIFIGYLSSLSPTFGRVPAAARYILQELGLMMFMAGVGLGAGGGIVEALASSGLVIVLCGVLVTLAPVVLGFAFGRYVLKLNPAILLGALTGAMTSTPALGIVNQAARSAVPALGYAGTYTFANVLLTFAGAMLVSL